MIDDINASALVMSAAGARPSPCFHLIYDTFIPHLLPAPSTARFIILFAFSNLFEPMKVNKPSSIQNKRTRSSSPDSERCINTLSLYNPENSESNTEMPRRDPKNKNKCSNSERRLFGEYDIVSVGLVNCTNLGQVYSVAVVEHHGVRAPSKRKGA